MAYRPEPVWKKYRNIKNKVQEHLAAIHVHNSNPVESESSDTDDHDDEYSLILDSNMSGEVEQDPANVSHRDCNENSIASNQDGSENCYASNQAGSVDIDEPFDTIYSQNLIASDEETFFDAVSSSSESESDDDADFDLAENLGEWVTKFSISHSAVNALLLILRNHHSYLPKDARTLLKTAKNYNIINVDGGFYYHFGISYSVKLVFPSLNVPLETVEEFSLQINIDGLPLFKSSNAQFWPILGRLTTPMVTKPFVIGLYSGNQKPGNIYEYTQELVNELNILMQNGICMSENGVDYYIKFNLLCVICDTPARAFVRQCKGHSGYLGCDKCTQRGVWKNKMTFPIIDAPRRTDISFDQMLDAEHHLGPSPFRDVPVSMVSQFPLDYMHLVCLGVVKQNLVVDERPFS